MAVRSVGIDLSLTGMHRAEAIDEAGNLCGHLSFRTTPEATVLFVKSMVPISGRWLGSKKYDASASH